MNSVEWSTLDYQSKVEVARKCKRGEKWSNNKTGKIVEVLGNYNRDLNLLHESGRITKKQCHYFAYDYSPC